MNVRIIATRWLCWWTWRSPGRRFHKFAQAELSSRFDLLAAANLATDPRRSAAYLRHAADEARHAKAFHKRANELGYTKELTADFEHLYERLGEERFLAFVARGENRAIRQFKVWVQWLSDDKSRQVLASVEPDELRHASYTSAWSGDPRAVLLWEFRQNWLRAGRAMTSWTFTVGASIVFAVMGSLALFTYWMA